MKRADVFSAIYPLSAAGMFEDGKPSDQMAEAEKLKTREEVAALRYPNKSTHARMAAWSPNPTNPPFFADLPVTDGQEHPRIQAKWLANSILPMLDQYVSNLRSFTAFQFDVGTSDRLLAPNQDLDRALTQAGIPHKLVTYDGDHNDHIAERLEQHVIPFFSQHLKFE
jgi:S-formylglutathione hydrolase